MFLITGFCIYMNLNSVPIQDIIFNVVFICALYSEFSLVMRGAGGPIRMSFSSGLLVIILYSY